MPDTGAPWNIPYVASTDLVSDWPADSLALANAIDAGLDAAGGLIDVQHVLKTDTWTSGSVAAGGSEAVTDLSITHTLANSSNKLIISAYFGIAAHSGQLARTGIAVADGGSLIGVGGSAGNRIPVAASGPPGASGDAFTVVNLSVQFVYEPGDTSAHTYTVHAINADDDPRTLYVNRMSSDTDDDQVLRGSSAFIIQEVTV